MFVPQQATRKSRARRSSLSLKRRNGIEAVAGKRGSDASNESLGDVSISRKLLGVFGRRKSNDASDEEMDPKRRIRTSLSEEGSQVYKSDAPNVYNSMNNGVAADQRMDDRRGRSRNSASSVHSRSSGSSSASPKPARSNIVRRAIRRLSLGKITLPESFSVYFDGRELGSISFKKPNPRVATVRTSLLAEFPQLAGSEFYFWHSKDVADSVDLEDEEITRVKYCLAGNMLFIASKEFMNQEGDFSEMQLSEGELREISPAAERVVRSCVRLLENAVFTQAPDSSNSDLPKMARPCVRYIKQVARATVDSRPTPEHPGNPNIKWYILELLLHRIEEVVVRSNSRQEFAEWWFYHRDQKVLMEIIGNIQQEFRRSPNLHADHPVFFFRFQKASPGAESIVHVLDRVTLIEFAGAKHDTDREKLANYLGVSQEHLRNEILTKREGIFGYNAQEGPLFKPRVTKSINGRLDSAELKATHARTPTINAPELNADLAPKRRIGSAELKATLAPLFDLQDKSVDEDIKGFCPGTREWALKAFDDWIADYRTSHRSFIFTGSSGSGKTFLASKLVRARSEQILAYHFCRHDDNRLRDPKVMLLSLIYQLSLQSPHFDNRIRKILAEKGFNRKQLLGQSMSTQTIFCDLLASPLSEISVPTSDRFVIVIDGIDEAKDGVDGCNEILDTIQGMFNRLPGWVLFFFTTKPKLPILKKLRKFNAILMTPTADQNEDDFKRFFEVSFLRDHPDDHRFNNEELSSMLTYNAGESFFFCTVVLQKLKDCKSKNSFEELTMFNLEYLLKRECSEVCEDNSTLFWGIVKLCMVAVKPLNLEVLRDLLDCEIETIFVVLERANSFFVQKDSVIRFVHKVSKDWLLNALGTSNQGRVRSERRVSFSGSDQKKVRSAGKAFNEVSICHAFFARQVKRLMLDNDDESTDIMEETRELLFRYGVHHLANGNMLSEAKELILNPSWLLSHATDLDSIVDSCELLSEVDQMLVLLARAVSLSGEATRIDHRQLIGQLVGRLIAVTGDGHSDDSVRKCMIDFLNNLRSHDYGFQWWCPVGPTWDQAEQAYLRTMVGHKDSIQSVAWHSDGRRCASGSWDGDIRVWDTLTGNCSHTLSGHNNTVWVVDWEPNGCRLASGSLDRSVRIWNIDTNTCVAVLDGHADCVWDARWSQDAKAIASASKDQTIRIWDPSTGLCLQTLSGSGGLVYSIAWEGGLSSRICSGSTDNHVRIWDTQNGVLLAKLEGHRDWVRSVDWCKTGRHIVSASADQTVRVWDVETFECEHVLMGHTSTVWSVSKSSDGRYVVSGSSDGTVRVWDCASGREEQVLQGHKGAVWSVAFCPDSKRVLSGSADKSLIVWDASVGVVNATISGHVKPIWCIDVSKDGAKIVSGSADKTARLWNAHSGVCEKVFSGHTGPVFAIKFSMDGKLVATGSSDNSAAVYRLHTGDRRFHLVGHTSAIWCVAWSVDDSTVFTGSKDTTIRVWDAITGKCRNIINGHTNDVKGIAISLDGLRLASASTDATIRVWDVSKSTCISVLSREDAGCLCVDWHPEDTELLVAGYTSGSVCVWNTSKCEREIDFLPGHSRRTNAVSWSPDGQNIASVSSDKEIRIWSMDGHQCVRKIQAGTGGIFGVVCKERYFVSCGADKSIRLFNPINGRCESVLAGENRNSLGILDMALSKNGKYAVSGSRQRVVQIWNAESGVCEKTCIGHTNWVHSVYFDESGQRVLSRSDDGTTRLWDVESGDCIVVSEDEDMTPEGFVAVSKTAICNLSQFGAPGQPVGVLCEKVRVEKDLACGWIGKNVYFFRLMGKKPNSE